MVLAEDGRKMSKSLDNYPEVTEVLDNYGADALRLYLLGSPLVKSESLNFDEQGVAEVSRKTLGRLRNVVAFLEMYSKDGELVPPKSDSKNVLDRWIVSRLNDVHEDIENAIENYELDVPPREIALFVDDLSTWYVRRSRDRLKDDDGAKATLRYVLVQFSKITAPYIPFIAEEIYQQLKSTDDSDSVHLCKWPPLMEIDERVIQDMKKLRRIVQAGQERRSVMGIKLRQPLGSVTVPDDLSLDMQSILCDELNVKEVIIKGGETIELDDEITPELQQEGDVRDVIRAIQKSRKEFLFSPKDEVGVLMSGAVTFLDNYKATIEEETNTAIQKVDTVKDDGRKVTISEGEVVFMLQ